jgi:hypothetical protein
MDGERIAYDVGVTLLVVAAMLAVTYLGARLALWAGMLSPQTSAGGGGRPAPPSRLRLVGSIGLRLVTLASTVVGALALDSWQVGDHVLLLVGLVVVLVPCFEVYRWRLRTGELYDLLRRR